MWNTQFSHLLSAQAEKQNNNNSLVFWITLTWTTSLAWWDTRCVPFGLRCTTYSVLLTLLHVCFDWLLRGGHRILSSSHQPIRWWKKTLSAKNLVNTATDQNVYRKVLLLETFVWFSREECVCWTCYPAGDRRVQPGWRLVHIGPVLCDGEDRPLIVIVDDIQGDRRHWRTPAGVRRLHRQLDDAACLFVVHRNPHQDLSRRPHFKTRERQTEQ